MESNIKKTFWTDAAKMGGIVGVVLVIITIIELYIPVGTFGRVIGLLRVAAFVFIIFYASRLRGAKYGNEGYGFGQNMLYVLSAMLFAGFIFGIGYWFALNYISPVILENILDAVVTNNPFLESTQSEVIIYKVFKNPLFWIFTSTIIMLIYGGLVGLIASAVTRRRPDPFWEDENQSDESDN